MPPVPGLFNALSGRGSTGGTVTGIFLLSERNPVCIHGKQRELEVADDDGSSTCLAAIPYRRRAEGKMDKQAGVILFSILAMVSGARSYRQIHTLIGRRLGLLNAAFPGAALRRAPAYTSVRGILQGLDGAELEQAF